jgi:hypothetical protein
VCPVIELFAVVSLLTMNGIGVSRLLYGVEAAFQHQHQSFKLKREAVTIVSG